MNRAAARAGVGGVTPAAEGARHRSWDASATDRTSGDAGSAGADLERWTDAAASADPARVLENFREFSSLVEAAEERASRGDHVTAAAFAEAAAAYAMANHPGIFASPALEGLLEDVGRALLGPAPPGGSARRRPGEVRRVLHVTSYLRPVGGVSRFIWRWIRQDASRCHSLALTRQTWREIPRPMAEAVRASGGGIRCVNAWPGGLRAWARRLEAFAGEADVVVVHVLHGDVLPAVALSRVRHDVPVILVDHTDHAFWLGAGTSAVVASLRETGRALAGARRHVEARRQAMLPTLIEPAACPLDRAEAKRRLGLPPDSVVLLTIARKVKYRPVNGVGFADAHAPLLAAHPRAVLVAVGPGPSDEWTAAVRRAPGRVVVHDERFDVALFHRAADVYVDSFPLVSITSLLEAGAYGLPLVTLFPHQAEAGVIGADMPGLDGNLLRARSHGEYASHLEALIRDEGYRRRLGEATRRRVLELHTGEGWQRSLEALYRRALALAPAGTPPASKARPALSSLDALLPSVVGPGPDADVVTQWSLRLMSPFARVVHAARMARRIGLDEFLRRGVWKHLAPEWFVRLLRRGQKNY